MARVTTRDAGGPRLTGRALVLALAGLVLLGLAGVWTSHWLVGLVYRGELLPGLLENRATQPLEHYHTLVDRLVVAVLLLGVLAGSAIHALRSRRVGAMLGILLAGDVIFCVMSELYGGLHDVRLDGGIPELYQYFKEAGIAWLLFRLFRTTGRHIFAGWAALYTFILLDDSLKYHERVGAVLANVPGLAPLGAAVGVRAVDLGEILAVLPVLLAAAVFLAWPFLHERSDGRRIVYRFGMLFVALILAGGVMDMVDRMAITAGSDMVPILSLIEDGGEMVVMSLTFAYAAAVARAHTARTDLGIHTSGM